MGAPPLEAAGRYGHARPQVTLLLALLAVMLGPLAFVALTGEPPPPGTGLGALLPPPSGGVFATIAAAGPEATPIWAVCLHAYAPGARHS